MDNNQQDNNPVQPASGPSNIGTGVGPDNADNFSATSRTLWDRSYEYNDLQINEPKTMTGNSVQSPFTGQDVSMTTGQPFGGPIVSTETEPNVRNEAGPY
jgi:hypothetical protein